MENERRSFGMTTKNKKKNTADYKEFLFKQLQDPELAAGYLTEALQESEQTFLLAIRDVVEALEEA